jgi:hypothetical protein
MKRNNLDQIELKGHLDQDSLEFGDEIPSRWEIMSRNADIPWRYGIQSVGENIDKGYPNNLHGYTGWYILPFEVGHKLDQDVMSSLFIE